MGGKRGAQPSGNAEDTAAANRDAAADQGGASRKRQTLNAHGATVGSAEARSFGGHEESGSILAPMTSCLAMHCVTSDLGGREGRVALEAALQKVVMEFAGQEFRVEWVARPSEDTLQRMLPLVLELLEPEGAALCFYGCKAWRREMEARGFCNRTVQLCSALAARGAGQNALRRLTGTILGDTFLQKWVGRTASLRDGLQAAYQEPDASFLSRGAASTALCLGLTLVQWCGKPQGVHPNTLSGHGDHVNSVALSSDGKRVASGSRDRLVKMWNAATGAEVCTLRPNSGEVHAVAFSPNGQRFVSASKDKLAKIWDAATHSEVYTLAGLSKSLVVFSPDGSLVASESGRGDSVKICNSATGAEVCTLGGLQDLSTFAFSPDGKRIATGWSELVTIWNAETGDEMCTIEGHKRYVWSLAFSPDGERVVSGSSDVVVRIWNAETGAKILSLGEHTGEGRCLCTLDEDGDLEQDEQLDTYIIHPECPVTSHSGSVDQVQFSGDGAQVITASLDDNTTRVWDVASRTQVRQFEGNSFALVEGPCDERTRVRHVLTAKGDTLLIHEIAKERAENGVMAPSVGGMAPVACFKAPQRISCFRCHGAAICVGCEGGAVCVLSAPFLSA